MRSFDFDDDMLETARSGGRPATRIYPFGCKAVVAGRGSNVEREVHISRVLGDGVPVFRRKGGGCSVFLDPGNLIVSLAFPAEGIGGIQALFNQCSQWLLRGFRDMGMPGVYQDGISDLVLENRKVGGSCFYRTRGLAYYSAAVLVTPDLDLMEYYLAHPPREPAYRRGRFHKEFVSGLDAFAPGITVDSLALALTISLDPSALNRVA